MKAVYSSSSNGGVAEPTTDVGGGKDVGQINTGNWMTYLINVPASASYKIEYRVASMAGGGAIQARTVGGGTIFGTLNVPSTGGWQTWTTISQTIALSAGVQDLQIAAQTGGFNLNWIRLSP